MITDLSRALHDTALPFGSERLQRFAEHELWDRIATRIEHPHASVDLTKVIGIAHPSYWDCTWWELLGTPPGNPMARLKRINRRLTELQANPAYYLGTEKKDNWGFFLVNGLYYIDTGNHRTVIARFFLSVNHLPQTISGVYVSEFVLKPESNTIQTAQPQGILRQGLEWLGHHMKKDKDPS